jgi:hypothetical protein
MAIGEAPVLETLADLTAVSVLRSEPDAQSLLMVHLAALIAVDAPAASHLLQVEPAAEIGITLELVQDVLVTVAPIVGTAKALSASAKIVDALGLAIELALEEG